MAQEKVQQTLMIFFINLASQRKQNTPVPSTSNHLNNCNDIEEIQNDKESSVVLNDDTNSTNSMNNEHEQMHSNENKDMLKMIDAKMDAKFAVVVKQCARIEALLKYHKVPIGMNVSQSTSSEPNDFESDKRLKEMGLPLTEIDQLKRIEDHLKDEHFESTMVFHFPC